MKLSSSSNENLVHLLSQMGTTPEVEDYLEGRGVTERVRNMFHLGAVNGDCHREWHRFTGMLAIPYLTVNAPAAMKFRRITGDGQKYDQPSGQSTHLFNVKATFDAGSRLVIVEGEMDAVIMHGECGVPAVAVPGATAWKRHYVRCVDSFEQVVVLTDRDDAGEGLKLAMKIKAAMPSVRIAELPKGEDVNSFFLKEGKDGVVDLLPPISVA